MTYSGEIEGGELSGNNIPCNGDKEETLSHFSLLPQKQYGFYDLIEHRITKKMCIVPDDNGFCVEELIDNQEEMIEWQYQKKMKSYQPITNQQID